MSEAQSSRTVANVPTSVNPIRAVRRTRDGVEVVDVEAGGASTAHDGGGQRRGTRSAEAPATPVGVHPHALDLTDRR